MKVISLLAYNQNYIMINEYIYLLFIAFILLF